MTGYDSIAVAHLQTQDVIWERVESTFAPVVERIRQGAVDRERERRLPFAEVKELRDAGFGALRVPEEFGGWGARLEDEFRLLIALGEADSNLPQLLRGHVAFVETQRALPSSETRTEWLTLIARGGLLFGNAQAERSDTTVVSTTLTRRDGRLLLNGRKYYSTGTLYADWIWSGAQFEDQPVALAVRANAVGVTRLDDWDGFGQRLTGSGTTVFDDVEIDPRHVLPWTENDENRPLVYTQALYQLILLASLSGIARAVLRDAVEFVQPRTRTFGVPGTSSPREDPLVQTVIGRIASIRTAVEAITLDAVRRLDAADEGRRFDDGDAKRHEEALATAFEAQQIVIPLVLESTTLLFEVGGASAVDADRALDRHWRNARTLSSHNPAIHRERILGDHYLNGSPVSAQLGAARAASSESASTADRNSS